MMNAPVPPSAVLDHWIYSVIMMILHRYSFPAVLLSCVSNAWHRTTSVLMILKIIILIQYRKILIFILTSHFKMFQIL